MAAAFDWSPGGCCCTGPAWFDLFYVGYSSGASSVFQRTPSLRPPAAPSFYGSDVALGWSIAADQPYQSHIGITRTGKYAWAMNRSTAGSASDTLIGYDLTNKVRKFTTLLSAVGSSFDLHHFNLTVGESELASFGANSIITISEAGAINNWGSVLGIGYTSPATGGPILGNPRQNSGNAEITVHAARLNWPTWAAQSTGATTKELFICDVANGAGEAVFNNRQSVRTSDYNGMVWRGFDYLDGKWCGAVKDRIASSGISYMHLYIDGQIIWSRQLPPGIATFTPVLYPHVCRPHETLGGGYIAVPEQSWTATDTLMALVVYKNGVEKWRTPTFSTAGGIDVDIQVLGSTDRWIYFYTYNPHKVSVSQMTNGEFTMPGDTSGVQYWLARHDGSQIMPMGTMVNTFKQISGTANAIVPYDCMVRDSQAVPGTIPAIYQEMWDNRAIV